MIRRQLKGDQVRVTFSLPETDLQGPVSVVGDFNSWTPGVHTLVRRSNGTRSIAVTLDRGVKVRFRYLGEGAHWFDDAAADELGPDGGVIAV